MEINLESIQAMFGGEISAEYNTVSGFFDIPGAGLAHTQVHLRPDDLRAPDGVRVSCSKPKVLNVVTDFVRDRLSLPPLSRAASDDIPYYKFTATPYVWRSTCDVPLRPTLYGRHLIRGYDVQIEVVSSWAEIRIKFASDSPLVFVEPGADPRLWQSDKVRRSSTVAGVTLSNIVCDLARVPVSAEAVSRIDVAADKAVGIDAA